MTVDDPLVEAARAGDVAALAAGLDAQPEKLHLRTPPYEWSLLHHAAQAGRLDAVDLLLRRGVDPNTRETGDNTTAMHWAAAAGHLDVVRRLSDAGGDVVGHGDDHELEVIGWATCFDHCHLAVAKLLVERGAKHHIFSAIAANLPDEVRRIVSEDSTAVNRRLSRNEDHRLPLHHAVRMDRRAMVALLLELGADPLAVDGSGQWAAAHATSPDVDRAVMERVRRLTAAEVDSAERGHRPPRFGAHDLVAALALTDWETAARIARDAPVVVGRAGTSSGVLHLMSKRDDAAAVQWLLDQGADPNGRWAHWDAIVTPLHLAILGGHAGIVRMLMAAGADPHIRDSKHDSDAIGWARHFGHEPIARLLDGGRHDGGLRR
jgi:ankyrin repeat protein